MSEFDRQTHWDNAYRTKGERGVSWFEESPAISLDLIHATGVKADASIIDIGGGASRLVDALLDDGLKAVTVLELSGEALERSRPGWVREARKRNGWSRMSPSGSRLKRTTYGTIARRSNF